MHPLSLRSVSLASVVGLPLLLSAACGDDEGATPKCSDIPLYDVRNPTPQDLEARKKAEAEGCATTPGTASAGGPPPPPSDAGSD